ncbi:MAG: SPOR domain-containing protein [Anaerovoracaceae bacterium]
MDRRYKRSYNGILGGLIIFAIIIALAVGTGFLFTKHIIYPYFLGEGIPMSVKEDEETGEKGTSEKNEAKKKVDTVEDQQKVKEETGEDPSETTAVGNNETNRSKVEIYTIQYGSFTTEAAARESIDKLKSAGIGGIVLFKDGVYKVVEEPYADEARVRALLPERKQTYGDDIFITKMEAWM